MSRIKNGNHFPLAVKKAALAEFKTSTKSVKQIALSFNVGESTLQGWARKAKLTRSKGRIPVAVQATPVVIASAISTAPVAMYAKASTTVIGIMYEGKLFT